MNTNLQKSLNIFIRLLMVVVSFVFLYVELFNNRDPEKLLQYLGVIWEHHVDALLLVLMFILLLTNIGLEAKKWQYVIIKLEPIRMATAVKGVMAGMAVSLFLPNRVGDYLGRVFVLKTADRIQATLVTMLGSLSQLVTTLIFGSLASLWYFPEVFSMNLPFNQWLYYGLIAGVVIFIFLLVFSYLNFSAISTIIRRISGRAYRKIHRYGDVFALYGSMELARILLYSIMRYTVFSFQFYLLLRLFELPIGLATSFILTSMIYLIMTVIPTIALTEFGIRGSVSLTVFSAFFAGSSWWSQSQEWSVVAASSVLWFINIVLPSAVGILFIFSLRFFRREHVG